MKILDQPEGKVVVALSGGPDSAAAALFFARVRRLEKVVHISYKDDNPVLLSIVKDIAEGLGVALGIHNSTMESPDSNKEAQWRTERYNYLWSIDAPVITGHNLDDCVETWLMSSLANPQKPKLIPYNTNNVYRPFLTVRKEELIAICDKAHLPYYDDPDNDDFGFLRPVVRHKILPLVYEHVNPGLPKQISKMLREKHVNKYTDTSCPSGAP